MLLSAAAEKLGLEGTSEKSCPQNYLTGCPDTAGAAVAFSVSPASQPKKRFCINRAFTAARLGLSDHSYPVASLQKRYRNLAGLSLQQFENARPLILIGADHPHLITPIEPVKFGPPGGPVTIRTRLGWTLQGPAQIVEQQLRLQQCLLTSTAPTNIELLRNVEKLWQLLHWHTGRTNDPDKTGPRSCHSTW